MASSSTTVPAVDQEICRRVETRVANINEDASAIVTGHESVTKVNGERHDSASASASVCSSSSSNGSNVSWNMTTIKSSGTPGAPRQLNVLSNFKYEYFVAGISGGVVSTLMLHPLDLIKIRFAGESRVRRTRIWRQSVSLGLCVTASTWYFDLLAHHLAILSYSSFALNNFPERFFLRFSLFFFIPNRDCEKKINI